MFNVLVTLAALAQAQPNVLVVVADDLGADRIGLFDWTGIGTVPPTPEIDQLALHGVSFENTWANPVCSPTRAAVMTGLAPARLRITNHIPDRPQFAPEKATLLSAPVVEIVATAALGG